MPLPSLNNAIFLTNNAHQSEAKQCPGTVCQTGKQGPTLAGGNLGEGLAPANLNGQHLNYPQLTSAASPPTMYSNSNTFECFELIHKSFSYANLQKMTHSKTYFAFSHILKRQIQLRPSCWHCCCCSFELKQTLVPLPSACITNVTSSSLL